MYPSFLSQVGRLPIPGKDYDPTGPMCQDDYEFYTGTGKYNDNLKPDRVYPKIKLTTGHVSIRRGKKIRIYRNVTYKSAMRLNSILVDGPTIHFYTNRSSVYTWMGYSTLTRIERNVLKSLYAAQNEINKNPDNWRMNCYYWMGIKDTCILMGIPDNLINKSE